MDSDDEKEERRSYNWEKGIDKTWENIGEDDSDLRAQERKRKKRSTQKAIQNVRKGMTRYVFVVLDLSKSILDKDMKPSRLTVAVKTVEAFILDYFDQNPLSQMGVIVARSSLAEKITELSGNPSKHISTLTSTSTNVSGEFSLQNSLEVARSTLCYVPAYGSREIIIVSGSLSTCDPGDIFETVELLKKEGIKVHIIGLSAEVYVCRAVTERTSGSYHVALNEPHFRELLLNLSPPPPSSSKTETRLIKMGFPQRRADISPSLCACHQQPKYGGYYCPQCQSKCCELPTDCQVCGLTLISSPHLARSYHHLFPVPYFIEHVPPVAQKTFGRDEAACLSCRVALSQAAVYTCPQCKGNFCTECDDYIHDSLHNCPGCEMQSRHNR
ncbi:TFIIH subunit [Planoprotostelium fungivorum]|uniref:General transcription factor IIH subunit n=1 Tax=Planoprotostelium fungivorum TaxID=1890364 RepID=A0A2P6N5T3_9EUKA|nr:TFIIH subunit [Planoprotostelium fungivorum]